VIHTTCEDPAGGLAIMKECSLALEAPVAGDNYNAARRPRDFYPSITTGFEVCLIGNGFG
jgi:hypothetical protein